MRPSVLCILLLLAREELEELLLTFTAPKRERRTLRITSRNSSSIQQQLQGNNIYCSRQNCWIGCLRVCMPSPLIRTQHAPMERTMHQHVWWQLQFISYIANALDHLKRAKERRRICATFSSSHYASSANFCHQEAQIVPPQNALHAV